MPVDLHLHSTASDGGDDPSDLVAAAAQAGLTTIALTDHDNLDGIEEAMVAAEAHGIELIPGSELSVEWPHGSMHMLIYFLEPRPGPLQDRLSDLQRGRSDRNHQLVDRLNELGIGITYEEVAAEAKDKGIGRPHFAAVMVNKGYVASIQQAFDEYLGAGAKAYTERLRLDYAEAISLSRASGAVPVLAHPHTIGVSADDYGKAFATLADAGIMGIESYYGEYPQATRDHIAALATELGLVATGGSDYHGRFKPDIAIGNARGDLVVPEQAAEDLHKARTEV